MGQLIAYCYPTTLFMKAADHTYVACGTGGKAWSCWGGKSGGKQLAQGTGSTKRADAIAQPDERAGITCYLVNGVCHQAANRILIPASITVRGARGYGVSQAMFGVYGRLRSWPCSGALNLAPGVSGDLPACVPPASPSVASTRGGDGPQPSVKEAAFVASTLRLYAAAPGGEAAPTLRSMASDDQRDAASTFHARLFEHSVTDRLGDQFVHSGAFTALAGVRAGIERRQVALEEQLAATATAAGAPPPAWYVTAIDDLAKELQVRSKGILGTLTYEAMFDVPIDEEPISVAAPAAE